MNSLGPMLTRILMYGSQSGCATLDQGDGGGNPFASSLIELLDGRLLTTGNLCSRLVAATREKSFGLQVPEVEGGLSRVEDVQIVGSQRDSLNRLAFVFVFSRYSPARLILPGARRDLDRVSEALQDVGFSVQTAIDLPRKELWQELARFAAESRTADIALTYMTGHGFENSGDVFLLPREVVLDGTPQMLAKAICVRTVASLVQARLVNLTLYGGCRTDVRAIQWPAE